VLKDRVTPANMVKRKKILLLMGEDTGGGQLSSGAKILQSRRKRQKNPIKVDWKALKYKLAHSGGGDEMFRETGKRRTKKNRQLRGSENIPLTEKEKA